MFAALSQDQKIVGGGTLAVLLVGLFTLSPAAPVSTAPAKESKGQAPASQVLGESTTKPKVETKTISEIEPVAFPATETKDSNLAQGIRKITTAGITGQKAVSYTVTLSDGIETGRERIGETIIKAPVAQVTAVGTKVAVAVASAPSSPAPVPTSNTPSSTTPAPSKCDPNYEGCVPINKDVKCPDSRASKGSIIIRVPVKIIGKDIYKLDSNRNGIACD